VHISAIMEQADGEEGENYRRVQARSGASDGRGHDHRWLGREVGCSAKAWHRNVALVRRCSTDRGRTMSACRSKSSGVLSLPQKTAPKQADLLLCARLQELAVAHHRLRGYRMLTALLRRAGHLVNHKRVLRLMREDNLLSLRRRKYVFTTDSTLLCRFTRIWHGASSSPKSTKYGWLTLRLFACAMSLSIWRWCWIPTPGEWLAGTWAESWRLNWRWERCGWP
jgi:hypothetical protein